MSECCLKGFKWDAKPKGRVDKLAGLDCYITGSNSYRAVLVIHDLYGWTFENIRVLADHYAEEVDATVYVPDFFGGEVIPLEIALDPSQWSKIDLPAFMQRNSKSVRQPEIFAAATTLHSQYKKLGAVGFCFGGWAVFRLGATTSDHLVDCIATAHPSLLEKDEMAAVGVPVQILAPEHDPQFTEELKASANAEIPKLGVAYDYQFFPGLEHAFATRGDLKSEGERKGMERAKDAVVLWLRQWLD